MFAAKAAVTNVINGSGDIDWGLMRYTGSHLRHRRHLHRVQLRRSAQLRPPTPARNPEPVPAPTTATAAICSCASAASAAPTATCATRAPTMAAPTPVSDTRLRLQQHRRAAHLRRRLRHRQRSPAPARLHHAAGLLQRRRLRRDAVGSLRRRCRRRVKVVQVPAPGLRPAPERTWATTLHHGPATAATSAESTRAASSAGGLVLVDPVDAASRAAVLPYTDGIENSARRPASLQPRAARRRLDAAGRRRAQRRRLVQQPSSPATTSTEPVPPLRAGADHRRRRHLRHRRHPRPGRCRRRLRRRDRAAGAKVLNKVYVIGLAFGADAPVRSTPSPRPAAPGRRVSPTRSRTSRRRSPTSCRARCSSRSATASTTTATGSATRTSPASPSPPPRRRLDLLEPARGRDLQQRLQGQCTAPPAPSPARPIS